MTAYLVACIPVLLLLAGQCKSHIAGAFAHTSAPLLPRLACSSICAAGLPGCSAAAGKLCMHQCISYGNQTMIWVL
ncbi:hypothetical protein COO60DRAFT_883041 [Scenedesmus sp. NREL 46B-D3]|nr:hypothetical protein COO60DRAFT_883041 [Scenedesmus sp. NREL 46B-D3]